MEGTRLRPNLFEADLQVHGDIVAATITSRGRPSMQWEAEVLLPAVVGEETERFYQPNGTLKVKLPRVPRARA